MGDIGTRQCLPTPTSCYQRRMDLQDLALKIQVRDTWVWEALDGPLEHRSSVPAYSAMVAPGSTPAGKETAQPTLQSVKSSVLSDENMEPSKSFLLQPMIPLLGCQALKTISIYPKAGNRDGDCPAAAPGLGGLGLHVSPEQKLTTSPGNSSWHRGLSTQKAPRQVQRSPVALKRPPLGPALPLGSLRAPASLPRSP